MKEDSQNPDLGRQRMNFVNQIVGETVNEAIARGMDPFLCVIILQTYNGLTVRGAGDSRVAPYDEKQEVFLAKIKSLVVEYCSELPGISVVKGSGPS